MSPEMAYGMPADTRSDIYSLGIVFFQMLSGHVPFEGLEPLAVLYMHANNPLPSLHALDPTIPAAIDTILHKATAKNPQERYASAGEMVKDLQSVLQQSYVAFAPQTPYASDIAATYIYDSPQPESTQPSLLEQHQQSTIASAGVTLKEPKKQASSTLLKVLPLVVLIVTIVFLGALRIGGVFAFPFLQNTPDTVITPTPSAVDLAKEVVIQYYNHINQRNYQEAYDLLAPHFQRSLSYGSFESGYSTTIRDDITFDGASQNSDGSISVSTTLNAHENTDSGPVYNTYQWNARLIQVNGAWRIESAEQWKKQ